MKILSRALKAVALLATVGVVAMSAQAARAATDQDHPGHFAVNVPLSGDLHTHDPAILVGGHGQPWYVFSTGDPNVGAGSIQIRSSKNGHDWSYLGTVWDARTQPGWVASAVPGVTNYWAPEITEHDGTYYLYYAASTFGSNRSAIGLYTNSTLDPADHAYKWVDRGEVFASHPGDIYNAIDPAIVTDASGTPWMSYGSFWGGIYMIQLQWPSGTVAPGAVPVHLADRHLPPNAIEGAYVYPHDGWYYLFVSLDFCCRATDSTYKTAVGRSRTVTGPYVDEQGVPLLQGGASVLLQSHSPMIGPGAPSVSKGYIAFHYYDARLNGDFQLAVRKLGWSAEGWPVMKTANGD